MLQFLFCVSKKSLYLLGSFPPSVGCYVLLRPMTTVVKRSRAKQIEVTVLGLEFTITVHIFLHTVFLKISPKMALPFLPGNSFNNNVSMLLCLSLHAALKASLINRPQSVNYVFPRPIDLLRKILNCLKRSQETVPF